VATPPTREEDEPKAKPKARPKATPQAKPKAKPEAKQTKPEAKPRPKTKVAKNSAKQPSPKLKPAAKQEERAPKQGYEPEDEVELGTTVHPPSGGELIESIADIFGELAGVGANAGGRLLKDALSIFRRP
jgi:outer membrane biosynthesis protein TonB